MAEQVNSKDGNCLRVEWFLFHCRIHLVIRFFINSCLVNENSPDGSSRDFNAPTCSISITFHPKTWFHNKKQRLRIITDLIFISFMSDPGEDNAPPGLYYQKWMSLVPMASCQVAVIARRALSLRKQMAFVCFKCSPFRADHSITLSPRTPRGKSVERRVWRHHANISDVSR